MKHVYVAGVGALTLAGCGMLAIWLNRPEVFDDVSPQVEHVISTDSIESSAPPRLIEVATTTATATVGVSKPAEPAQVHKVLAPEPPTTSTSLIVAPPIAPTSSMPTPPVSLPAAWKKAIATVFWVGEGESSDNSYIHNRASAWDEDWVGTFGGVDDPDKRCGFAPCGFTPKQSPFYVALPYLEYTDDGYKKNARDIPWYTKDALESDTLVHGHWVAVQQGSTTCYGQWRDTGPYETDDFAYVFGTAPTPRNKVGVGAGIDLSPAMRDCLGVGDVSTVLWRFVDVGEVPRGPWQP